jgi:integrase
VPRRYPHSHLCHGALVGFTVKLFGNEPTYCVFFRSKDGRRVRRDTNRTQMAAAIEAARAIIEEDYAPAAVPSDAVSWDAARQRLRSRLVTAGASPETIKYYLKALRLVRAVYGVTHGPADISPGMAATWRDQIMTTVNRRKKLPSAHYVAGLLRGLSALWQKWFMDELNIVSGNPWEDVELPKTDTSPPRVATDELIEPFYAWIAERFGDWPFPKLFLATKAYTGCRLMELCGLKSAQLHGGRLVFPAHPSGRHKERAVPLPAELYAALDDFKGKTWLWGNYLSGLRKALRAKGWPTHQLNAKFSPRRLYFWVETLFADYRTAHPDRPVLTTQMFRKRAFTLAWQAGVDLAHASIAYGCNPDTLRKHSAAMDEQEVTDAVFARLHGVNESPPREEGTPPAEPGVGGPRQVHPLVR